MVILHNFSQFSIKYSMLTSNKLLKNVLGRSSFRELSSFKETFKFNELELEIVDPSKRKLKPDPSTLAFGKKFCDHMFAVEWDATKGWGIPCIRQMQSLSLHPAAKVLHYAQEVIEGMKAFRGVDGKVALFRPMLHINRLLKSSERAALPQFNAEEFCKCIKKLVSIEQEWVPNSKFSSLYIRPTGIGIEPTLGIGASEKTMLFVICGPVGSYFGSGIREPVSLFASPEYVRAWPGGTGNMKMGSNYAITLYAQEQAKKRNLQQVLWLFDDDHQLTEVGAMNIFVHLINENNERELVTPPLNGIILPGIVRQSILELMREWNECKVSERIITMNEVIKAVNDTRLLEIFGSGTAAVVCSVSSIAYMDQVVKIPTSSNENALSNRLYDSLTDIQYGKKNSKWMESVD